MGCRVRVYLEASDAIENALDTLHDYVHFRLDTSGGPDAWEEAHDAVEDAIAEFLPGAASPPRRSEDS